MDTFEVLSLTGRISPTLSQIQANNAFSVFVVKNCDKWVKSNLSLHEITSNDGLVW